MKIPKPTSRIELSRSALEHNIDFIHQLIGSEVTYSAVVKGNAYGHGICLFSQMLFDAGVRHFSTFSADEAYEVLKVTEGKAHILIMGLVDNDELEWVIANELDFFIFDSDRLQKTIEVAKKIGKPARVHFELETGMNRTGFPLKGFTKKLESILEYEAEHLNFQGICTHLAGAESIANYHRVKKQQKRFRKTVKKLQKKGIAPPIIHSACSAAAIRYPNTRYNFVRIGILQYGFFPSTEILTYYMNKNKVYDYPLRRVISWKTKVMDIKHVQAGEFIGYGTSYFTNVPTTIALVPVGYAHGFSRSLSNQGKVLIRGRRLNVIGTVNMNMIAVDVSDLEQVEKGDEVVMIGWQGNQEISVSSFSDFSALVNYETLTRLPHSTPRIVVE